MSRSDARDAPPPHEDELRHETTFGRTDRYANEDDPESPEAVSNPEEEIAADERRRRLNDIDAAQTDDARMEVRREEHSAD